MATVTKTDKIQTLSVVGSVVTLNYPSLGQSVSVNYSELTVTMQIAAGLHGLAQKLGDAASGKSPTEKFEMASRIVASITDPVNPSWNLATRETSIEDVVNAVCKLAKKDVTAVLQQLKSMGGDAAKEKIAEWRASPHVKFEIIKQAEAKLRASLDKAEKFTF